MKKIAAIALVLSLGAAPAMAQTSAPAAVTSLGAGGLAGVVVGVIALGTMISVSDSPNTTNTSN